ncbi:DUF2306 domain-containing protein [Piscinibacter sp.]|uniref:DUF2306 domain-containing protein n=1 Tax=Piscinibacter sp. TaxID=1903157 RepID=UPI0039E5C353
MVKDPSLASLAPAVVVHLVFAAIALVLGPVALWAHKGSRGHRAFGYAWVTAMAGAALSAFFIRSTLGWQWAGFSPIHLLALATLAGLAGAIHAIARGRVALHRKAMQRTYFGACVGAGLFALLPGRYLGDLLWHHALGLV